VVEADRPNTLYHGRRGLPRDDEYVESRPRLGETRHWRPRLHIPYRPGE